MVTNWKTAPKAQEYKDNGVDGSLCSIQTFLATVEQFCPPCPCSTPSPSPAPTAKTMPPAACQGPYPDHPSCESRIVWMAENWNTVSWTSSYVAAGVDGSRCSMQLYLATVEKYCPAPLVQAIEPTAPPSSAPPSSATPSSATPSSATPPDNTGGSGAIVGTVIGVLAFGIFGGVAAVILVRRRRANSPIDDRQLARVGY
jgi:LPXTG-motif cell wall-anchored protein